MISRSRYAILILILAVTVVLISWLNEYFLPTQAVYPSFPAANQKVLLVPLDSRPPCTQFVVSLSRIAGIEIILPPSHLIDNYDRPGNQSALRQWVADNFRQVDAVILSSDMLIHGGLLASRNSHGTQEDVRATLLLLSNIHEERPNVPLYVFSIIPRLLLADSIAGSPWQKPLMDYSIVKHQASIFDNPRDLNKLRQWENVIPPEFINRYITLYDQSININKALIDLANRGILTSLTLGQDDGLSFGLPNIVKQKLAQYAEKGASNPGRVTITRGTDEVALTLLGHYVNSINNYKPRIFVTWSHPSMPTMAMPYMPHSTARTIEEKVAMIGGKIVNKEDEADFILFVHTGNRRNTPLQLSFAAKKIEHYIQQGYQVALVDLTENYFAHETLLPYLIENNIKLTRLAAYAGWNTTSNSVGTAITQAAIFTGTIQKEAPENHLNLYAAHLTFLIHRFLDDWYYQKEVQHIINSNLKGAGADPYHLKNEYDITNDRINRLLRSKADIFFRRSLKTHPIIIGPAEYRLDTITFECKLPWDRTFEILLEPKITFTLLSDLDNPKK